MVVGRQSLSNMEPGEVIVAKWEPPLKYQYYRNVLVSILFEVMSTFPFYKLGLCQATVEAA